MNDLGLIGLTNLSRPISMNPIDPGYTVTVYNWTRSKPLEEATESSNITITRVSENVEQ